MLRPVKATAEAPIELTAVPSTLAQANAAAVAPVEASAPCTIAIDALLKKTALPCGALAIGLPITIVATKAGAVPPLSTSCAGLNPVPTSETVVAPVELTVALSIFAEANAAVAAPL